MDNVECGTCGHVFQCKVGAKKAMCPKCENILTLVAREELDFVCPNCEDELTVPHGTTGTHCPGCELFLVIQYGADRNDPTQIKIIAPKLN